MLIVSKDFLDERSRIVIQYLEKKLGNQEIRWFIENYVSGEEAIAYEMLCNQIYDNDIKLPKNIFILIKEMCLYWYLDFDYWMELESLVIGDIKKCSEVFGKVLFPKTWDEQKIKKIVSDIAIDPNLEWIPLTSSGESLTKDGKPARFAVKGISDGVTIRVIVEPNGEGIIAYYPICGQGVSCFYLNVEDYNVN